MSDRTCLAPAAALPPAPVSDSRLRRSLTACTAEGVVAELVGACTGASVLMGWALHLGASTWIVGLLASLPFLAQLVQVPAACLTSRFGGRRMAILAVTASRQAHLALAALPLLSLDDRGRLGVLLAVAALSAVLGVIGNNAWVAWMGDLVPGSIRGRYFGRRTALCTLGGAVSSLAAGAALDAARGAGRPWIALGGLALLASAAGALTTYLMTRQHRPRARAARPAIRWADVLEPLADARARRVLAYQAGWGMATGLTQTFCALHLLQHLGVGFVGVALHAATASLSRTLAAPIWGRALDRVGARPILITCSVGLGLTSLLWLFVTPDALWLLAVDAILSGSLTAGHGLAAFALPLRVSPRDRRAFYLAAFAMAGGLAFAAASTAAGALASALPGRVLAFGGAASGYHLLFAAGAALRGVAALLATRLVDPGARPVRDLLGPAAAALASREWRRAATR